MKTLIVGSSHTDFKSSTFQAHYSSDSEVRKVVGAFVKNVEKKLNSLSLDDIERICDRWNSEQVLQF